MINFKLKDISELTNGKLIGKNNIIKSISINSKKISKNKCLFLAFKGKKINSHEFVFEAVENGATALLVENFFKNINVPQIIVKNTNESFFKISKFIRKKSKAFFIAITGSCGKTTVKEMIVNILRYSNKNFSYTWNNNNNKIGVSLSLLSINKKDKFVIIELGMNKLGEIFESVKLVKPDIILINNISICHIENLNSINNLIKAKGEIFYGLKKNGKVIINYNNNYWIQWKFYFCNINRYPLYFSLNHTSTSDFYSKNIKLYDLKSSFTLENNFKSININLNVPGIHNIYNAIASFSISCLIGISLKNIKFGLENFKGLKNRLYPIYLCKKKIILNDTYNSNIESAINSIKVLSKIKGYKLLIIGDMYELGKYKNLIHSTLGKIINDFNINKIISIGNLSKLITINLLNGIHINKKTELIIKVLKIIKKNKEITLLFKASRLMNLDKVVELIIKKYKNEF